MKDEGVTDVYNFEVLHVSLLQGQTSFLRFDCLLVFFLILHPNLLLSPSRDRRLNLCTNPFYVTLGSQARCSSASFAAVEIDSF